MANRGNNKTGKSRPRLFVFTDIAGLVKGASRGEVWATSFSPIRKSTPSVMSSDVSPIPTSPIRREIDPVADIETVNLRVDYRRFGSRGKTDSENHEKARLKVDDVETEYKALAKVAALLRDGRRAIEADLTPAEVAAIKQYQLLTLKPVIYVLNVDESGLRSSDTRRRSALPWRPRRSSPLRASRGRACRS